MHDITYGATYRPRRLTPEQLADHQGAGLETGALVTIPYAVAPDWLPDPARDEVLRFPTSDAPGGDTPSDG
jgi:hypothetical protein